MSELVANDALSEVNKNEDVQREPPDEKLSVNDVSINKEAVKCDVPYEKLSANDESIDLIQKTDIKSDVSDEKLLSEGTEQQQQQQLDPYAYLDRADFTSEKFKIEVRGLPKYYGMGEFRKLLNVKLNLGSSKIKTLKRGSAWAYVCFRNEEDRCNAIKALNDYKWKGNTLTADNAKAAPDPLVKKRRADYDDRTSKKFKDEGQTQEERLKFSTTPYWNVPYDEQLRKKQDDVRKILLRTGNDLGRQNVSLLPWLNERKSVNDGLPCELWNIRAASETDGYRNKCEFTVGTDDETGLPTVGFRIGSYVTGVTGVGPVDSLKHIPDSMKTAVKIFQNYVRSSDLAVFDPELQTGHFRQLTARSAPNQLMLIVGIHPQSLIDEELSKFKQDVVQFFTQGEGKEALVTSLYYQNIIKRSSNDDRNAPEHLHGDTHIYATISDLKFRISPEAFFQVNTDGAAILYDAAIELAKPTMESTVVDICCGTGTIGLCFAKKCKQVLGIEIVPEAVVDAKQNAVDNDIKNADFFSGKAEEIISSVMRRVTTDDVIAIVDPPRAGLHQKAIMQLRRTNNLNKLVYISCNPAQAAKNFIDLGRPQSKTMYGEPFVPVRALAVDMFPHTKHCELVIYFERFKQ